MQREGRVLGLLRGLGALRLCISGCLLVGGKVPGWCACDREDLWAQWSMYEWVFPLQFVLTQSQKHLRDVSSAIP